jgi:TRAP-type C4-dicarboxylate transport system substrate-binding protein
MDSRLIRAVTIVALGVTLGGCGGVPPAGAVDKAGSQTLVLQMASQDGTTEQYFPPGLKTFVESLAALSGGRIQVAITYNYTGGGVDSETNVVRATAAGDIDGGWPTVRGFANAGIRGLEAVEAPMVLTSYSALKDLVSGPVASDLLGQLHGTGVVGLGLAVGSLRRPFAAKAPLLEPGDWHGITFRTFYSPVQDATILALGGTPMDVGSDWTDYVATGQLRGAEFDIVTYAGREFGMAAPYVTANVVLWPKVFAFILSQKRWDAMTDQQRAWVHGAAAAGTQASVDASYDESALATKLCSAGVNFVNSSPSQLAALRAAVAPVIGGLAADSVNGPLLAKIEAIAARYPEPEVPDVPADCRMAATPSPPPSIPTAVSSLPSGTYRVQITLADVAKAGSNNSGGETGTWTLTIEDGSYVVRCQAVAEPGVDCGNEPANTPTVVETGLLRGAGQTVYFVPSHDRPYWLDWALSGTTLTFTDRGGGGAGKGDTYKPWTKIG